MNKKGVNSDMTAGRGEWKSRRPYMMMNAKGIKITRYKIILRFQLDPNNHLIPP